jgi:hypothetical protein
VKNNTTIATTLGAVLLSLSSCYASSVELTSFDKKIIEVQRKMIATNPNFNIKNISIINKKSIDDKWKMYTFDISLIEKKNKKEFNTPMVIFTDGIYETNSLMNIETGVRYENEEKTRLQRSNKSKETLSRETFEKSFRLDSKYYNKEHLISGSMDAKNKVVIISDPLCVACISMFPSVFKGLKDKKDFALFYYHYPLRSLHPTAETISMAMDLAKSSGIKDIELKVYEANFDKLYNVYKVKDKQVALSAFNKVLGTNYTLEDVNKHSVLEDMKIGSDIRLQGTPSIIFNGEIYKSREKLIKAMNR